jgi:ubiquinone/menaquinone biosynthesis C-methylase UbiE
MDDRNFDEKAALDWIKMIEDVSTLTRKGILYPALNSLVAQPSVHEILDIGCGQGRCSDHIDLTNRNYTGLEPSDFLLARARELYPQPNRKFVQGSAYKLPFNDNEFDVAFSVATWHLFEKINLASKELERVLKTDARFLVVTANPDKYDDWKKPYTSYKLDGHRLEGQVPSDEGSASVDVLFLHTIDELFTSFEQAALTIQKTEAYGPFIYIWGRKP